MAEQGVGRSLLIQTHYAAPFEEQMEDFLTLSQFPGCSFSHPELELPELQNLPFEATSRSHDWTLTLENTRRCAQHSWPARQHFKGLTEKQ